MHKSINRLAVMTAVALALPLAVLASAAQASMVTTWGYDVENGFTGWTSDGEPGGTGIAGSIDNPDLLNYPTKLSWSDGSDTSSISIEPDVTAPPSTLATNGATVTGADFTHVNHILANDTESLSTATILSQLTLTPKTPSAGSTLPPVSLTFGIDFTETDNNGPLGACPGDATTVCDDIFVLTSPTGGLSSSFTLGGYKYTVFLDILGLKDPLDDTACDAAGAANGCRGILTAENATNIFGTEFNITAVAVPTPGTLSLFALGMLCLVVGGFSLKRRAG